MKGLLLNTIPSGLALTAASSKHYGVPINPRFFGNNFDGLRVNVRNRNRTGVQQRTRRRRRNNYWNSGIEINKAEGGFKNITNTGRIIRTGINTYLTLIGNKWDAVGNKWQYMFKRNDSVPSHMIDVTEYLNSSTEFLDFLKRVSQYKVLGVNVMLQNSRVPKAGEVPSRLLFYASTDKIQVDNPKVDRNVMRLNMNTVGTKNFNFKLNKGNTNDLNLGWQDSSEYYNGAIQLRVSSEDDSYFDDEETNIMIGTVKVTITVLGRLQDSNNYNAPSQKMKIEEEIKKLKERLEHIEMQEEEKEEEKEVQKKKVPAKKKSAF